jgi:exosortase
MTTSAAVMGGRAIGSWRDASMSARISIAIAAVLLLAWIAHLWPEWTRNPDLSHGLMTPLLFGVLIHEARRAGTARFLPASFLNLAALLAVTVASVILLGLAGLYAAALAWSHALVDFLLAAALCTLLAAVWIYCALRSVRLLPFCWPAAAAILLWALSSPIPPGSYTRLTQHLQGSVAEGVLVALHLLGITAVKSGNVIELPHVSVGVEEACSGIRSLISCIWASVFISAVLVRTLPTRILIVALSAPLAIGMNLVRSLCLTLLAHSGVDISGAWHDVTGFAVLAATAAILAGLAWLLSRKQRSATTVDSRTQLTRASPRRFGAVLLAGMLSCAVVLGFFVAQTRAAPRITKTPPNLDQLLPTRFDGWTVHTRDDLYRFTSQLQTNILVERTYQRASHEGDGVQFTVYVAYWPPGQAPVSLVASHTPDACWPGSGWVEDPGAYRRVRLTAADLPLPSGEQRSFHLSGYPQHVWYWHLYGGQPVMHEGIGSPLKLLSLAWHYGFRKDGEQLFVRFSSNRPWTELSREPLVREIVTRLQAVGLRSQSGTNVVGSTH